ncbi:MAG: hypothetical protein ACO1SV_02300 [Fimbriimonas sp.]
MPSTYLLPSLALLLLPASPAEERIVYSAVTSAGRPIAGVKVYARGLAGTTDTKGKTNPIRFEDIEGFVPDAIAVAPDGRLAVGWESRRLVFGPTADLTLRVVDGHGRPAAGREITIFPTQNTPPLETTGFISPGRSFPPALESRFTRTTDAKGRVVFPKLPRRVAFRITTDVGFDDPMHLGGAIKPGPATARVVLADELELAGTVTRGDTGQPLAGVKVNLWDTGHGHMSGYPGTILETVVTDAAGRYRFKELPNCAFNISPDGLREIVGSPYAVTSKVGSGPWTDTGQRLESYREGTYSWSKSTSVVLERPIGLCDFRAYRAAMVTIRILNPHKVKIEEDSLWLSSPGRQSSGGGLSNRSDLKVFALTPGRYSVVYRDARRRERVLQQIDVKDGETRTLQITVPTPKPGK